MGPNRTNNPAQVIRLQTILKNSEGLDVDINGIYDAKTVAAVKAFQLKYADEILKPWGLTTPTGFTYLTTRKKLNEVYCAGGVVFPLTPAEQAIIDGFASNPTPPAPPRNPQPTPPQGTGNGNTGAAAGTPPIPTPGGTEITGTTTDDAGGSLFSRIKKWFTSGE